MKIPTGWATGAALAAALSYVLTGLPASAQTADNPYNDELLQLPPPEQAAKLAAHLGLWCIGTKPFLMGVTKTGPAKGYAYWSVECAGDRAYMIQIAPDGKGAALDCATLKANGEGRQCYKTF